MASLDALLPFVLVHVPSAPHPLAYQCMRLAARELCRRTFVWRAWLDCEQAADPVTEFTFTVPDDAELVRFEKATLDDQPLTVASSNAQDRDWVAGAEDIDQSGITADLVTFTVTGAEVDGEVKARVALMPTLDATTVPNLLATRHLEAVASGAAARLLRTKGAEFYDLAASAVLRTEFEDGVADAARSVYKAQRAENPRPNAPQF